MALDGVIFDVDGTLLDTNPTHVEAWVQALEQSGYRIPADRIEVEVGKGGDHLVPALIGARADQRDGDAIRAAHADRFAALARERQFAVFPGALQLIDAIGRRGIRTALATSSRKSQLEATCRSAGVDLVSAVDVLVTADDASSSKPSPDLVRSAVDKLELSPAQCAMVGDTPYDAEACLGAGVVCLGVRSGGNSTEALLGAGARAVWDDTAALLNELDEALSTASPGKAHLTWDRLEQLMRQALAVARDGLEHGEAPIGSVIADGDGQVVARGYNEMQCTGQKTAHAEIVAFRAAAGRIAMHARDLILVSTLEPCVMCTGAAMEAAADMIVFGLPAPADSGTGRVRPPVSQGTQMPRIIGRVLPDESRALFGEWLARHGEGPQAGYIRQLLEATGPGGEAA
ncbi:MAG TPA: HAD family hydrolase [Gemmatimonadales bacterium]|nr:HAD family hydrolase [Gemmatimonadales bacterium]